MKTRVCNESMVISIPIGKLKEAGLAELMPEKDFYKIFVLNGKPKPLGAAQALAGVFLYALGVITRDFTMIYTLPSVLAKLSFSLNIISFFWSLAAFAISVFASLRPHNYKVPAIIGFDGLIMSLLVVECFLALFLIYWLSKAICRQHFNTLPITLLKHGD